MSKSKHILFGILNWGLGHSTRSIPVINALLKKEFTVTIASDGLALELLKNEFPNLNFLTLENLNVEYSKKGSQILAVGKNALAVRKWYLKEQKTIDNFLDKNQVCGIISDNRPSVFSSTIPSVYITHQINLKASFLGNIVSFGHQQLIKKYTQIWVPDVTGTKNLSGDLGHKTEFDKTKCIGVLSDLAPTKFTLTFDVSIILSGPEPQRTLLENKLIEELKNTKLNVLLLRGTTKKATIDIPDDWKTINLANRKDISEAFKTSKFIIARSGYSTLMDLYSCPKPALLIPTPGQPEQEYLASMPLHKNNFAIQNQDELDILAGLKKAEMAFDNFDFINHTKDWNNLFNLFQED